MSMSGGLSNTRIYIAIGLLLPLISLPAPAVRGQTPAVRGQTPAVRGQTPAVRGQTPDQSLVPAQRQASQQAGRQASQQAGPQDNANALTPPQRAEIGKWIEALGSAEFAKRERAASRLMEVGVPVLPELRRVAKASDDPEKRLRAAQIVKQLTEGDLETRIARFLGGEEVHFGGWGAARAILGDSNGIRELFVELMRSHPDILSSLEGTARDRTLAMDAAVGKVQDAMFIERKFPTRADAFALLLPAIFPDVPLNTSFEKVLLSVLQKEVGSKLRRDAQLSIPFRALLGRWIRRSTLASRNDVLLFGMSWDAEATLPLAVQTLGEANQTETLAFALQVIARFGNRDHVELVRPLIDDTRLCSERGYTPRELVRTQLGDVAMATIAVLHKVPLSEAGFGDASTHPTYGFILAEIGFPVGDPSPRKAARAKIDRLLEDAPVPEGS